MHTSTAPIIDQLPDGDVSHLILYAPFHDEKGAAVQQLIERLQPRRVTLAVQSDERTVIQPDALRLVLANLNVQFDAIEDAGKRYWHGKLIEAVRPDGSRWTLTGSPNLSARALLLSASEGGNIEVGVITEPADSIFAFPESKAVELGEVPAVRVAGAAAGRAAGDAMLLAAVRVEDGLEVVFSKVLTEEVRVLASVHDEFDSWTEVGVVPSGAASHVMAGVNLPGGSRVRSVQRGAGSALGGIVFVTDPRLVMAFPGESTSRGGVTAAGPVDLISDPGLLEKFLAALSQLASPPPSPAPGHATGPAVPRGEDSAAPASTLRLDTAEEDWLAYTDDAKASPGPAMFRFIMAGFPGLRTLAPAAQRLALLTAVLIAVQAGIWDSPLGERGWIGVLSMALENLDQDHIPEQLTAPLASWAALATYLMHDHRPMTGRPAEVLSYEKATRAVSHLFPAADHQLTGRAASAPTSDPRASREQARARNRDKPGTKEDPGLINPRSVRVGHRQNSLTSSFVRVPAC